MHKTRTLSNKFRYRINVVIIICCGSIYLKLGSRAYTKMAKRDWLIHEIFIYAMIYAKVWKIFEINHKLFPYRHRKMYAVKKYSVVQWIRFSICNCVNLIDSTIIVKYDQCKLINYSSFVLLCCCFIFRDPRG